jgi:hypothetical protein
VSGVDGDGAKRVLAGGTAGAAELPAWLSDSALLAAAWERIGRFLLLTLQLGLAIVVVYQFQIESRAFLHLLILTFFGFAIHYYLPLAWRLPFFLVLSLAGIALVFGFAQGAWLIGLGLALIGIVHLPVSPAARVGLLLAAAGLLALLRVGVAAVPWSPAVWPILGSMFMFRLAVYLYDVRHEKQAAPWSQRLAYFFLLPNVCFPLFPVVDYRTFRRTYYEGDRHQIYQVGMVWIVRGIVHLVLYRLVYYHLTLAPGDVDSFGDLARYMLTTFLLYLRVSGQFHLIIGMLHLFGFNLPETHHFYYLASGFNDFWRRINIYWKDFMMKLFYYPAFFKLRKRGPTSALVLSTLVVFAGTWLLHSYQWFWLRGSFPLALQDGLFWGILGALVVWNSLREAKQSRARSLGKRARTLRESAALSLGTAGTFVFICVLWSLWNSASLSEWLSLWVDAARGTPGAAPDHSGWLALLAVAAVAGGALSGAAQLTAGAARAGGDRRLLTDAARTLGWLALLLLLGLPAVFTRLGSTTAGVVDSLQRAQLSNRDADQLQQGYYEDLVRVDRFNSQLWEVYMKRPVRWEHLTDTPAARYTDDIRFVEHVPGQSVVFHGAPFSTNSRGLRDREYAVAKPPGTRRIAMLGSSHVVGDGVGDGEPFEARLEELLDQGGSGAAYEVLNFGISATTPIEILARFEREVLSYEPDAVFWVAHSIDAEQIVARLVHVFGEGREIPYDRLRETLRAAGVERDTAASVAKRLLSPHGPALLEWVYTRIVEQTRARGAVPVWIYLPRISERVSQESVDAVFRAAERSGFVMLSLADLYDGADVDALRVAEWDHHPNARGHQMIAERIHQMLLAQTERIPLGLPATAHTAPGPSVSR